MGVEVLGESPFSFHVGISRCNPRCSHYTTDDPVRLCCSRNLKYFFLFFLPLSSFLVWFFFLFSCRCHGAKLAPLDGGLRRVE